MQLVKVRLVGTGQVDFFIPSVAHSFVTSGRGVYVDQEKLEVAAIVPKQEQAMLVAPLFKRGPR